MAEKPISKPKSMSPMKLSAEAQKNLIAHGKKLLTLHQKNAELHDKMELIDIAYARYKTSEGKDTEAGNTACDVFSKDEVTPPIVVSQVDSMVAYWAEVFLSGYPLFPVVSLPQKRQFAEQLESLLDDHATIGGYARQLLMFLIDAGKYNFSAIECDWEPIQQYSVLADFAAENNQKIQRDTRYYTKLRRLDPYNTVVDNNVLPGDVAAEGDFAGYISLESRIKLKRRINRYSNAGEAYNTSEALALQPGLSTGVSSYYRMPPQVSDYITARKPLDEVDWSPWFGQDSKDKRRQNAGRADNYEIFTYYARIIPNDMGIEAPQPNTPQIWKVVMLNSELLIHAKRVITAYDTLPILVGQPIEDGLGLQTESVAEGAIEFQDAAKTLYNIRFAAARRAVSDRALYDPDMISPSLINSKAPAPKIPVNVKGIQGKSLGDAYHQIPFDLRGTETTLQDAAVISEFAKDLRGLNNAQRGQFQKGNKSVTEWNDVMGGSDARLRLPALILEHQVFVPLKEILKLNIFQYGEDTIVVSQKTGEILEINIPELRKQVLSFKVGDGFTPKAKLASSDMITTGLQMISTMPALQQQYGAALPSLFAHLMQLGGVRGLEQYLPQPTGGMMNGMPAPMAPAAIATSSMPASGGAMPMMGGDNEMMEGEGGMMPGMS